MLTHSVVCHSSRDEAGYAVGNHNLEVDVNHRVEDSHRCGPHSLQYYTVDLAHGKFAPHVA